MKKAILLMLSAALLVSCGRSFPKSEWKWLEDEIRARETIDYSFDKVYSGIENETYSTNFFKDALAGKYDLGEDKTGLGTFLFLGIGASNSTWEDAYDKLDDFIEDNDYDASTIHDLPDDVEDEELGLICKILAEDVVKYFDRYYDDCELSFPQYVGKQGQRKYYSKSLYLEA